MNRLYVIVELDPPRPLRRPEPLTRFPSPTPNTGITSTAGWFQINYDANDNEMSRYWQFFSVFNFKPI